MKPVVIDVTRLVTRLRQDRLPTGVDRVSLAYIAHYRARGRALFRWWRVSGLFSERASQRLFDLLLEWPNGQAHRVNALIGQGIASCVARGNARGRLMFNTGHSGLEGAHAARVIRYHNVRPLFLVHDLIPVQHPEFCRPGEAERHEQRLRNMLQLGAGLIANSSTTLEELHDFAAAQRLPVPPTVVAPLAPALPLSNPIGARPLPGDRPYFVTVGTIEPRKNHLMLLQAWQRLILRHGERTPHLVVIGQQGWESENVEDLLQRSRLLQGHVTVLRECTDLELLTWMHHARALLFPSFAEGYGMPVVEALAAGLPVLASDLPVLRRVADEIPEYLDPIDTLGWIQAIEDYASPESPRRAAQLARMAGYEPPTWRRHFERVDDFAESLGARQGEREREAA
ncbi:glycosyltransferase family 4 protein [Piscinibacter sakaiensis]|uniref:Glycosyl transferase, group 1 n=1 Tax=Piscinibacter sakaiensis TaxID=1547922 RepID=A0A0K8P7S6_PISS1|nr:glycosyltransferase family 1 protein [Piscinibacter sakaiensis]GAP38676.1 glycosyl transferase, group 1 [Piscinibacter sakaiensis]